jgi:hypothetical protein
LSHPSVGRATNLCLVAGAAGAASAFANDTTAELTTGGLVLMKSNDIEMRSEDLAISQTEIAVSYRFFNRSPNDEVLTVAFPMPEVVWDEPDTNIAIPNPDAPNFLDFRTLADGREVHAQYEQKAFAGGVEISARLAALGVPLAPQNDATREALDRLPRGVQDELVAKGIVAPDDFDVGKGWEHHVAPAWTFKSAFYWRQTFPAGREIVVEHHYKPSVGETTGTSLDLSPIDPNDLRRYETRYCVDNAFLSAFTAARGKRDAFGRSQRPFFEKRIAYVLTSGANWAGPIGDFHLTVDKGAPDSLVSFCADGVRKIGPILFEVRHENFTPTHDLDILILYRAKL